MKIKSWYEFSYWQVYHQQCQNMGFVARLVCSVFALVFLPVLVIMALSIDGIRDGIRGVIEEFKALWFAWVPPKPENYDEDNYPRQST
jgi:hypothetical protein